MEQNFPAAQILCRVKKFESSRRYLGDSSLTAIVLHQYGQKPQTVDMMSRKRTTATRVFRTRRFAAYLVGIPDGERETHMFPRKHLNLFRQLLLIFENER